MNKTDATRWALAAGGAIVLTAGVLTLLAWVMA